MSDVDKIRGALVACCLNNLYGFYASLQISLKKETTIYQSSQNLSKRRGKEILRDFRFDLDRLAHGGTIFAPARKSLRNEKKFRMPQDSFEKLCTRLRPYIQKNKGF